MRRWTFCSCSRIHEMLLGPLQILLWPCLLLWIGPWDATDKGCKWCAIHGANILCEVAPQCAELRFLTQSFYLTPQEHVYVLTAAFLWLKRSQRFFSCVGTMSAVVFYFMQSEIKVKLKVSCLHPPVFVLLLLIYSPQLITIWKAGFSPEPQFSDGKNWLLERLILFRLNIFTFHTCRKHLSTIKYKGLRVTGVSVEKAF